MGSSPVINITFVNFSPTADEELVQRFHKWVTEVYVPIVMRGSAMTGTDRYFLTRKNPEYPTVGTIQHWENIDSFQKTMINPDWAGVSDDLRSWVQRGIRESVWSAVYELVKGFRPGTISQEGKKDTRVVDASIAHLEAYRTTSEEEDKYNRWFADYSPIFVQLLIKNRKLKGYDYFKYSGLGRSGGPPRETEYPQYLSILYFEDLKAFEDYQESPEQLSFQGALRNIFPVGLNYKWYVQYQLEKSWRK